jgi:Icc-related predicted phosphoesterase
MKIQAFGCTHGFHDSIKIEDGVDMLIHTGDFSNYRDPSLNFNEVIGFLNWYEAQNVRYKVLIAGNHDTSIEKRLITPGDIAARGIVYLEHQTTEIEGLNIFGSPFTPTFGTWSFMRARDKMHKLWKNIDDNTDIIISHGPPRGILDLTENRDGYLEMCGDASLLKHCERVKPKHVFFSHIHNRGYIQNRGTKIQDGIQYHNVNCVEDFKLHEGLKSNGLIINI